MGSIQTEGKGAARVECVLLFALFLMVAAGYCNTLYSPPFLDDEHSFVANNKAYVDEISIRNLVSISQSKFGWGRWLPMVTFALNHKLGDGLVIHFHLTNIFIHILSALAVFYLVKQILAALRGRNGPIADDLLRYLPVCVAALWAMSPVQTSAVTYLVQRMASLQSLFYMLCVALYIKGRIVSSTRPGRSVPYFLLATLAAACSALSKENSVVLPIMLVLTEIWFFEGVLLSSAWRKFRRLHWLVWAVSTLAAVLVVFVLSGSAYRMIAHGYTIRDFTMGQRLLTEARVVVLYISLLLWPDPDRLSMECDPEISTSLLSPATTLPSILLIALLLVMAVWQKKKQPLITYGVVWFFVNLAVESTVIPLELVFEHRLYLPSAGFFLSAAAAVILMLRFLIRRVPDLDLAKVTCCAFLVAASGLTLLTFTRNEAWQNAVTINMDTVAKTPGNARANANFATALFATDQYEQSIAFAEKGLELGTKYKESNGVAMNTMVISFIKLGQLDRAIERGEQFLATLPRWVNGDAIPMVCLNLAEAHILKQEFKRAHELCLDALRFIRITDDDYAKKLYVLRVLKQLAEFCRAGGVDVDGDGLPDPGEMSNEVWMANEVLKKGEKALAREILQEAVRRNANDVDAAKLLAGIEDEEQKNQIQKAKWNGSWGLFSDPSLFSLCMGGATFIEDRHLPGFCGSLGEKMADAALAMRPDSLDALLLKGWYFYSRNEAEQAVREARKALDLDGENARTWMGLGFFLAKAGQKEEARFALNKVIELYPGYSKRNVLEGVLDEMAEKPGKDVTGAASGDSSRNDSSAGHALKKPASSS